MQHQTRRFTTHSVAVGIAIAAIAAPTAAARPAGPDPVSDAPTPVAESIDEGFDVASAAIGAGAAGALVLLASAGGSTYRRRHNRIPSDQAGTTR